MIIVDKREKNSLVLAGLLERKEEIKIERLEVGDYIIGDIAIERKTMQDFISSMLNKRLLRQLEELKQYPKQLLIVEGIDERCHDFGKLNPNAIRGMLLSILFDFNIPIILTKNPEETVEFLILLEKRQKKSKKEISLKAKKKVFNLAQQQEFVLESFPGIGPVTAKTLLKKFKTIKAIINATPRELERAKLSKNKIITIERIVNSEYVA